MDDVRIANLVTAVVGSVDVNMEVKFMKREDGSFEIVVKEKRDKPFKKEYVDELVDLARDITLEKVHDVSKTRFKPTMDFDISQDKNGAVIYVDVNLDLYNKDTSKKLKELENDVSFMKEFQNKGFRFERVENDNNNTLLFNLTCT